MAFKEIRKTPTYFLFGSLGYLLIFLELHQRDELSRQSFIMREPLILPMNVFYFLIFIGAIFLLKIIFDFIQVKNNRPINDLINETNIAVDLGLLLYIISILLLPAIKNLM